MSRVNLDELTRESRNFYERALMKFSGSLFFASVAFMFIGFAAQSGGLANAYNQAADKKYNLGKFRRLLTDHTWPDCLHFFEQCHSLMVLNRKSRMPTHQRPLATDLLVSCICWVSFWLPPCLGSCLPITERSGNRKCWRRRQILKERHRRNKPPFRWLLLLASMLPLLRKVTPRCMMDTRRRRKLPWFVILLNFWAFNEKNPQWKGSKIFVVFAAN